MLENIFSCRLLSCDKTKHFHWHFTQSLSLVKTKVKQFLKNCWDWTLIEMKLHCLFASFFPFLIASNIRYLKFIIGVRGLFLRCKGYDFSLRPYEWGSSPKCIHAERVGGRILISWCKHFLRKWQRPCNHWGSNW